MKKILAFGVLIYLFGCSQPPNKNDWLEDAPELSQDTSGSQSDTLSNIGHASHGGHH